MYFENKVFIVTGGSAGIGAALAIKLSQLHAKIVIVARNQNRLEKVSNICEQNGNKLLTIAADVTKDEDARRIVQDTIKTFGKLDVLVNNAGTCNFVGILEPNTMENFDYIINVNLRSAIHLTHLAAPHLIETKGCIINISSVGSTGVFYPKNYSYCASKAGLDHFTRCVALELAPKGVRVNCVNPGPVKTSFLENTKLNEAEKNEFLNELTNITALGKISEPEEIADLILLLASDKAKSITGSTYVIDNGMLLK